MPLWVRPWYGISDNHHFLLNLIDFQIDPVNDGTFQHDVLLTETQANTMINEINQGGQRAAPVGFQQNLRRRGRSALFLEVTPTQRWPAGQAIPFMFDQSLSESDKAAVRQAVQHIQSKTCVRFQEVNTKPSGSHIYYMKVASPTL